MSEITFNIDSNNAENNHDFEKRDHMNLDEIKERISQVNQKPLDQHPIEFENIHADLVRALSEIDGL
jgi:hypothetical protein